MEKIIEYLRSNKSGIASVLKEQNVYVFNETELIDLVEQLFIQRVRLSLPSDKLVNDNSLNYMLKNTDTKVFPSDVERAYKVGAMDVVKYVKGNEA